MPAARPVHPGIPTALTPLVGRDAELRELRELFAEQRFVTLVGPGGVGKTRLALEVGRTAAEELSFGGCLVELAPVGIPPVSRRRSPLPSVCRTRTGSPR